MAIADPATAAVIEQAHAGAVQDALGFIEAKIAGNLTIVFTALAISRTVQARTGA